MTIEPRPLALGDRVVARAPVRVADVGGWTDTWFGSPGQVCSVAVGPGVEVSAEVVSRPTDDGGLPVHVHAPDVGIDEALGPSDDGGWAFPTPGFHPLIEHAAATILESVALPAELGIDITIRSAVPPGASLGTSAAVVVAILATLDALVHDASSVRSKPDLARLAHWVETVAAGREAGVQDQWATTMGGVGRYVVGPYPDVHPHRVDIDERTRAALAERLVTVVFASHDSSAVHHEVIRLLTACGGAEHDRARAALRRLASLAAKAADALGDGDLDRWAGILVEATDTQASLAPGLVGANHHLAIELARSAGAVGWKVNGAGGDGGSLTIVAPADPADAAESIRAVLQAAEQDWTLVALTPADGLEVSVGW